MSLLEDNCQYNPATEFQILVSREINMNFDTGKDKKKKTSGPRALH